MRTIGWMALAAMLLPVAALAQGRGAPSIEGLTASSELAKTKVPLAQRITTHDPKQYNQLGSVHGGSGPMQYMALHDSRRGDRFNLGSNLLFLHRGVLPPGGGIGGHYHNTCEEMFVIFNGEAEFTIDGRTSTLKGPAGAPLRQGHWHAISNQTKETLQFMNINVGSIPGYYDAFDLGDGRVGVPKDAVPTFMTLRLDRALLRPVQAKDGGEGTVQYRRALEPSVFATAWSYVDHYVLPPGASFGPVARRDMSEVFYVMNGAGSATISGDTAPIKEGDAVPAAINETRAIRNTGTQPLELMVIGVAKDMDAKRRFITSGGR